MEWSSGPEEVPGKAARPLLHAGCPETSVAFGAKAPGQPRGGFASSTQAPGVRPPGWAQAEGCFGEGVGDLLSPPALSLLQLRE